MRKVKKLLGFILIGGAVICLTMAAVEYMKYDEAIQEYDDIEETYTTTEDSPETPDIADESFSIDWASLKQQNADLVGWIRMDTGASYPIVQGTDNSYYLKHSFNNTYSINGAIFMNSHNSSSWEDYNTVVYGHNMNNGSMFGSNKNIKRLHISRNILISMSIYLADITNIVSFRQRLSGKVPKHIRLYSPVPLILITIWMRCLNCLLILLELNLHQTSMLLLCQHVQVKKINDLLYRDI